MHVRVKRNTYSSLEEGSLLTRSSGGPVALIYYAVLSGDGSALRSHLIVLPGAVHSLPHAYVAMIAYPLGSGKRIDAAYVVRSAIPHDDPEFAKILRGVGAANAELGQVLAKRGWQMLVAPVDLELGVAPSQEELDGVVYSQLIAKGVAGHS